ncbi:hypothetical protein BG452_22355 [Streptomyces sp. CBMA123]|nr:hypothetical protein [Streptomyces sp. CBMA123]
MVRVRGAVSLTPLVAGSGLGGPMPVHIALVCTGAVRRLIRWPRARLPIATAAAWWRPAGRRGVESGACRCCAPHMLV